MSKVMLVIVFFLTLAGCVKQQGSAQKKDAVAPVEKTELIEPIAEPVVPAKVEEAVKEEAGTVQEKAIETVAEGTSATEESGAQVAPPAAIVEEMQAQVKGAQQQEAQAKPAEGIDEVIAKNGWGFSVYDPKTGIEEFYTSKGALLGSKKRL